MAGSQSFISWLSTGGTGVRTWIRGQESSRQAGFERGRVSAPSGCRLHLADKRRASALAHGSERHEFLRRRGHRPEKNSFCGGSRTAATAPPEYPVDENGIVEDGRGPRNSCHILHNDGRVAPSPLGSSRPYVTSPRQLCPSFRRAVSMPPPASARIIPKSAIRFSVCASGCGDGAGHAEIVVVDSAAHARPDRQPPGHRHGQGVHLSQGIIDTADAHLKRRRAAGYQPIRQTVRRLS